MTNANTLHRPMAANVNNFLDGIQPAGRRDDAYELLDLMMKVTGEEPVLWGTSIVGFGKYHYVYDSGREGDSCLTGFAPRKANMVVYVMPGFSEYQDLLAKLGKHKTGVSCLYLGRLNGVDKKVLKQLVVKSVKYMRKKYSVAPP